MRVITNKSYCSGSVRQRRVIKERSINSKARSVSGVFFTLVLSLLLILISGKLLSMLETYILDSVDPVSAAVEKKDYLNNPYRYQATDSSTIINPTDLPPAPPQPVINPVEQPAEQKVSPVSWLRSLLIPTAQAATKTKQTLSAQLISIKPTSEIKIDPGKAITIELKFKNTGNYTWSNNNYNFLALATIGPEMRKSLFKHQSWEEAFRAARLQEKSVKPGKIGTFKVLLQAPKEKGEYIEKFQLVARRLDWVANGQVTLYINVGNIKPNIVYKPTAIVATNSDGHSPTIENPTQFNPENTISTNSLGPTMRVGLYDTRQPITVTANGSYYVKDQNNNILYTKQSGKGVTIVYDWLNKIYILSSDDYNYSGANYLRLELLDPLNSFFTILSLDARPDFNQKVNYNDFRYILEFRYTPATDKYWVINELPMEKYLLGISETHKVAPYEFLKAMTIAARTYAQYHQERQTKHASEFYLVDATYDQVYRGAAIEDILTDWKRAVADTAGQVLTYDGKIAITPFFASSDGRTRSFKEVWKNEVPWLQSVSCEYEVGGTLSGHGVGLSAVDAMRRAKAGADYLTILHHYYLGTAIKKIY